MQNAQGAREAMNIDAEAATTFLRQAIAQVTPFLFNAVGALIVLVVGLWIAGRIKKLVSNGLSKSKRIDATLAGFLSSLVYYGLIALIVITTLGVFGVPTTSFAAVIGAAGLAIGLALQGTLGHVASGVMLLGFRPFSVGDFIEAAGHSGTVKGMTLMATELATLDNKKVIIPNGAVFNGSIINYSAYDTRRLDLVFGVSYNDDLNKAIDAVKTEIDAEARILKEPEPAVAVDSLGDSSVNLACRVWVASSDYLAVKWALTKAVKERFDASGITIPFPTRQMVQAKA
ncbi:MAG: mechanosensitive ion channel domain-containing protein [Pseudomonadota bacterium]|nr:mechanosensitive ion channel domain-containing protein [Pseudomonadota bacterium]